MHLEVHRTSEHLLCFVVQLTSMSILVDAVVATKYEGGEIVAD